MDTLTEPAISDTGLTFVPSWIDAFREYLQADGKSARTIEAYLQDLRMFAAWFEQQNGQPFSPELITGVDLRSYRQHALDGKMAPATFNRRRATLARLIGWAMQTGYLTYDPMSSGLARLAEQEPPTRWLTKTEEHALLRAVERRINGATTDAWRTQAVRDQAIVFLMLFCGLREEEVSLLDVDDVQVSDRKGKVVIRQGKGAKRRQVPMNNECRRAVRLWIEHAAPSGALFENKRGDRLGVSGIQDRIEALRQAAGLDELTPHMLRHTFGKRLADANVHLHIIARMMGHNRMETTARYTKPGWEDLEEAVAKH